ncbi:MAG: N-acetylneuraminate synthase family protein [Candidatus Handelsmanbacteria bacterium]|nr:N-acetylneuraminate synthase family protein [Candidatus Handelsmanbacteria bacterium]
MKIGGFDLDQKVLVIAEIGNNHEGSYALAEELVGQAARAGAGAVKFQTIVPRRLVAADQADRIRQLERFQLSYEQFTRLSKMAAREGVLFLSTPFDLDSARFLEPLVPAYKIASGDNTFLPLLEVVAGTGKPLILSTGLLGLEQVAGVRDFIAGQWRRQGLVQDLALLHCVVNYPTAPEHANLLAIRTLQSLGCTVGYSDHTLGIEAAVLAVALGARIIEKHFTLSKTQSEFRDHQLSADPSELGQLVARVGEAGVLLGEGRKELGANERDIEGRVRRSLAAGRPLEKGAVLRREDLAWVRPSGGLAPGREEEVLGKALRRDLAEGEPIALEDCEGARGG